MSIVSNNIKYLRRLNGLTQEQFARKIAIKRSLLGAYEEARANPNLTNLKNMAAAFGVSVDNLLKNDLRRLRETPEMSLPLAKPMTVSHSGNATQPAPAKMPTYQEPQPLAKVMEKFQQPEQPLRMVSRQVNLKPIAGEEPAQPTRPPQYAMPEPAQPAGYAPANQLPVFNNQFATNQFNAQPAERPNVYQTVQWVPADTYPTYLANFQNAGYLNNLPTFQLPNLAPAYYRAFEAGDDHTYPGALLIGTFVRNWYDIHDGMQYIFVLKSHGIQCKTAHNQVKTSGLLILTSEGSDALEIPLQEVMEVWEVKAFVGLSMPAPQPSLDRIVQLVDELQMELAQYRQQDEF